MLISCRRTCEIVRAALLALTVSCSDAATDAVTAGPAGGTSTDGSPGSQALGGVTTGSSTLDGAGGTQVVSTSSAGSTAVGGTAGDEVTTAVLTGGTETSTGQGATGGMSLNSNGQVTTGGTSMGSGGSNGTAGAPATCSSSDWATGDQTITLMQDGIEREYEVHVPPGYTGTTPVPLMLAIHGAHNTPWMVRNWSQMDAVADDNGFIVAYPAGLDCWNSGLILPGCTAADDDLGFLLAVVSDIQSHACIDARVYASGISNGSMMAQYMGCEAADVFAAVAGVAAGVFGGCSPSRPIAVFYVHGTEDRTVSYSSAQPSITGWADRNGCNTTPVETYNMGSTVCETYQECDGGVEVEFCTVNGMGHCWPEDTGCGPGGGPEFGVSDFKASPRIWEFFERHPLP